MKITDAGSLSLTEYLGCMHAFVNAFIGEMNSVKILATKLEQEPAAFGWQTSMDKARYRAPIVLERWKYLNETFDGKISIDKYEEKNYGNYLKLVEKCETSAGDLTEMLRKFNRYIDAMENYNAEEIELIVGMTIEMTKVIDEEAIASSDVANRLDQNTPERMKIQNEDEVDGLLTINSHGERIEEYFHKFFEARDIFYGELQK